MIRNEMKELTEGMQRLCAVANRVVATEGRVSRIEKDLLLEALRHLYEIAVEIESDEGIRGGQSNASVEPDEGMISSTVMATMSAMAPVVPEPEMPEEPVEPFVEQPEERSIEHPVERPNDAEMPLAGSMTEELPAEGIPTAEPESAPEPAAPAMPPSMAEFEVEGGLLFEDEGSAASVEEMPVVEPEEEPALEPEEPSAPVKPAGEEAAVSASRQAEEVRQPSLLDYLKHPVSEQSPVMTLGERLSGGAVPGVEALVKKVDDLRTVININDKFSFMSELFKNNMRGYNDFIMHLNSLTSREEALAHVKQVAGQYGWDENSAVVKAFYKVFDKKF